MLNFRGVSKKKTRWTVPKHHSVIGSCHLWSLSNFLLQNKIWWPPLTVGMVNILGLSTSFYKIIPAVFFATFSPSVFLKTLSWTKQQTQKCRGIPIKVAPPAPPKRWTRNQKMLVSKRIFYDFLFPQPHLRWTNFKLQWCMWFYHPLNWGDFVHSRQVVGVPKNQRSGAPRRCIPRETRWPHSNFMMNLMIATWPPSFSTGFFFLDVSENRGKTSPQIIHFNRVFHYKPFILGSPIFGNTHLYIFLGAGKGVDGLETARTQKDLPKKRKNCKEFSWNLQMGILCV